jgi:hypothetical protein
VPRGALSKYILETHGKKEILGVIFICFFKLCRDGLGASISFFPYFIYRFISFEFNLNIVPLRRQDKFIGN